MINSKEIDDRSIKKANSLFSHCVNKGIVKYSDKFQLQKRYNDPKSLIKFLERKYKSYIEKQQKRMF